MANSGWNAPALQAIASTLCMGFGNWVATPTCDKTITLPWIIWRGDVLPYLCMTLLKGGETAEASVGVLGKRLMRCLEKRVVEWVE